ncbi:MAG: O-antigen ligase family protein [Solirubrobacteraceae bacterium]
MSQSGSNFLASLLQSRAVQLLIGVLASAAAAVVVTHSSAGTAESVAIGLVVAGALVRWPALTVVSLLIVCQELDPAQGFAGPGGSGLLFLGHQLYFKTEGRFSLLTLALLLPAAAVLARRRPARPRLAGLLVVLALGAYFTARVWADGSSVTSAINQESRFAILFALCFVIGAGTARSVDWKRSAVPVMRWVLSAIALLGLYLLATGQGQAANGSNVIFYDSALGTIAGAVVLAALLTPASERDWRLWWLAGAGLVIVILSARRNVWAAMAVALIIGLMFATDRMRLILRLLGAGAIVLVAFAIFLPAVMSGIGHQLSAIWGATQGTAADASTQGHLSDIAVGWRAVEASPINGVGPNGHVLGLVVEGAGPLYIHNEVLESWLRFGIVGALLVVAVQVVLAVQAVRALRLPGLDLMSRWAAMLLVMAPVGMLTAPFLTTTQRWPAILGLAAGLVASTLARSTRSAPAPDAMLA